MSADSIPQPYGGTHLPVTPPPRPSEPPARRRPTALYYRQHGISVTGRHLIVADQRYDLAELGDLMQDRGTLHPGAIVALVIAVAEAMLVALLVSVLHSPLVWLLAVVALLIPCLVALVCARRWPPQYELLAQYRGHEVRLFATRDQREFGQVTRALRRALEALRGE
jgi:hypothetical protein